MVFASARLTNQCSFEHSSRNFPLKLSACVLDRLARSNEAEIHAMRVGPRLVGPARKLRSVVEHDRLQEVERDGEVFEHPHDTRASQRSVHFDGHAFATEVLDDVRVRNARPSTSVSGQRVAVRSRCTVDRNTTHRPDTTINAHAPGGWLSPRVLMLAAVSALSAGVGAT